jgi:hypothetical protein
LQDLRRRLYVKAKAEPTWRFWGLYVHVCNRDTLYEAYQMAKENGAPGIDGVTFAPSKKAAWRDSWSRYGRNWSPLVRHSQTSEILRSIVKTD